MEKATFRVRQGILNWLLNFLQTDLDRTSEEEKALLDVRLSFLYCGLFLKPEEIQSKQDRPWLKLFKGQRSLFPGEGLKTVQTRLRKFLDQQILPLTKEEFKGIVIILPTLKRELVIDHGKYLIRHSVPDHLQVQSASELIPEGEVLKNYLAELLEGLPEGTIKKCRECGKLFAKGKFYCSPKCAFKYLSRMRRDELKRHPRKHKVFKKEKAEKMRQNYLKKQRGKGYKKISRYKSKYNGRREKVL